MSTNQPLPQHLCGTATDLPKWNTYFKEVAEADGSAWQEAKAGIRFADDYLVEIRSLAQPFSSGSKLFGATTALTEVESRSIEARTELFRASAWVGNLALAQTTTQGAITVAIGKLDKLATALPELAEELLSIRYGLEAGLDVRRTPWIEESSR